MNTGIVKWFDPKMGYGFITGDNGRDVFVHQSMIVMNGYRTLEADQRVTYEVETGEKGEQAVSVRLEEEKEEEA